MQFKLVAAFLLVTVALCALLPLLVEGGKSKWLVRNKTTCMAESRNPNKNYTCKGCCDAKGYDSGSNSRNYCTCEKKGSSASATREGDEVVEKRGWFSKEDVHEEALPAQESYGSMTHYTGYDQE